jgi:hypothetical protein
MIKTGRVRPQVDPLVTQGIRVVAGAGRPEAVSVEEPHAEDLNLCGEATSTDARLRGVTVFVITGIQAAGKSTVAQELSERFERSVHVRGDLFRRMVVNGRVEMGPADPPAEAVRQLRLRYALAASVADGYTRAGFTVVLQDIVLGTEGLESTDGVVVDAVQLQQLRLGRQVAIGYDSRVAGLGYESDEVVEGDHPGPGPSLTG